MGEIAKGRARHTHTHTHTSHENSLLGEKKLTEENNTEEGFREI